MHATEILQSYLDDMGRAVLADDWDSYCNAVCLPCLIVSHDESKTVTTIEDLKAGCDLLRDTLRAQPVTDHIRLVAGARRVDPSLIAGRYVTHRIAGSRRLMPPFWSDMTLPRVGGTWRATLVTNALAHSRWPLVRLELNTDSNSEGSEE
ncbi:MAG: hypothetical protein WCS20_16560 [Alphaproteobacteria bacterium]